MSSFASGDRIKVLVADGSRMVSQLLGEAVRRDHRLLLINSVVGSAAFLQAVQDKVDICLISADLDETSPGSGFEALKQFRVFCPKVRAVMLLNASTRSGVLEAFRSGAKGVLCKNQSLKTLSRCIRCVYAGQVWISNQELEFILEAVAHNTSTPRFDTIESLGLTRREQDVIKFVAEGLTNRQIASQLQLSEHTVKNYLLHVFEKLGVSSRVELLLHVVGCVAPAASKSSGEIADLHGANLGTASLQQAAEHGCPSAQVFLAKKYLEGNGLPKDNVSACMWLSLAEKSMSDVAGHCTNLRQQLAAQLTHDQLSEGERRALDRAQQVERHCSILRTPRGLMAD